MLRLVAGLFSLAVVAGCASSTDRYTRQEVGRVMDTSRGTVVAARPVGIEGERTGIGAAAGGIAAGTAGYATIGKGSGSVLAGVLAGLAGVVLGGLIEEAVTSREGVEYTIAMDDGRTVTLVQEAESKTAPIAAGTPVMVQWGGEQARVFPLAETGLVPASDEWVNPDTLLPTDGTAGQPTAPGEAIPPRPGLFGADPERTGSRPTF